MYSPRDVNTKRLALRHLEAMQESIDAAPRVIAVIKAFDGKVVNARLDTVLKAADPSFYHLKPQYAGHTHKIGMRIRDRYVDGVGYIKATDMPFCYPIIPDRLDATKVIAEIRQEMEGRAVMIAGVREQLDNVDKLIARENELIAAIKEHNKSIHWLISDYYQIGGLPMR